MKKIISLFIIISFFLISCNTNKETIYKAPQESGITTEVSLLNMMRRLPGIILRNNKPVFNNKQGSISSGFQKPLYILDDYIVGSSFASLEELIDVKNIKEISVMEENYAAIYGSRAANGVIQVTTFK